MKSRKETGDVLTTRRSHRQVLCHDALLSQFQHFTVVRNVSLVSLIVIYGNTILRVYSVHVHVMLQSLDPSPQVEVLLLTEPSYIHTVVALNASLNFKEVILTRSSDL